MILAVLLAGFPPLSQSERLAARNSWLKQQLRHSPWGIQESVWAVRCGQTSERTKARSATFLVRRSSPRLCVAPGVQRAKGANEQRSGRERQDVFARSLSCSRFSTGLDVSVQICQPVQLIEGSSQHLLTLFLDHDPVSLFLENEAVVFEVAEERKPVVGDVE